jgi:hypothetical protein
VGGVHETGGHRTVQPRAQRREEAAHVEHAARLVVDAELRPGEHLEELVHRPVAAGQHDKGVRRVGHGRLALVHGLDDAEAGQAGVRDLLRGERAGDHAVGRAAARQHGLGDDTHQADLAPAVHEADAAPREQAAERLSRRGERRIGSWIRAAVDGDG